MSSYKIGFKNKKIFLESYKLLKKNGCKKIEPYFNDADEYDNKGKCYRFAAEMIQRIDRSHGLAMNRGRYVHMFYSLFYQSWRDGEIKRGVIKGLGNYKYQTTNGSMNNVVKGKVIIFE